MLALVLDHLWQSTVLALGLGVLALTFRKAPAAVRHGLWFCASAKFLVPFAALALLGRLIGPAIPVPLEARPEAALIQVAAQPFSQPASPLAPTPAVQVPIPQAPAATTPDRAAAVTRTTPRLNFGLILLVVWGLGSAAMLAAWAARWARLRRVVRSARRLDWSAPMPVLAAPLLIEPGLVGLWRPVLLVPETLPERLSRPEIDALLAHEACHLRRRDNLLAAQHMLVEALFWFHPLVWWIGARLIEERERACDEAVVRAGHDRTAYARSLVEICRHYLQSPLDCVSGASGSDLKTRVAAILHAPPAPPLSRPAKALLLTAGACAIATPVMAGLVTTPEGRKAISRAETAASRLSPSWASQASASPSTGGEVASAIALSRGARVLATPFAIASLDVQRPALTQDVAAPGIEATQPGSTAAPVKADSQAEETPPQSQAAPSVATPGAKQSADVGAADAAIRAQLDRWSAANAGAGSASLKPEAAAVVQSFSNALLNKEQICIRVEGTTPDRAAHVLARVTADARAAGVSVGRSECVSRYDDTRYDVEIRFAADAGRAVHEILVHRDALHLEKPSGANRPIQAWYIVDDDHAADSTWSPTLHVGVLSGMEPVVRDTVPGPRQAIGLAIVVVDPARTQDMNLDTLSDYVALLALSQPRALDRCNVLPSIADLFAGACPGRPTPTGLTIADTAYLKTLYTGSRALRATRYRSELVDHMARLLGASAAAAG